MPDVTGKLDATDVSKVIAWLDRHGWKTTGAGCPICADRNWTIAEHLVQPLLTGGAGSIQMGGIGYPQVMMISSKCGYTMYLNAVMIGLIPPLEK